LLVIPAQAGLRRQDAEANIRVANGLKGEPQDAASNPVWLSFNEINGKMDPGFRLGDGFHG